MDKPCHRHECEVAFADTDASGRVHFSKVLVYVEEAEHSYLRRLGVTVFDPAAAGWPRVRVSCDYKRPLVFQEKISVLLKLERVGGSSLAWAFEILKEDGAIAAIGEMVTVKVNGAGEPAAITEAERKRLEGVE